MTDQILEALEIGLSPCPKCKSIDLYMDSVANGGSFIECNDCEYRYVAAVSEKTLTRRWNKLDRTGAI